MSDTMNKVVLIIEIEIWASKSIVYTDYKTSLSSIYPISFQMCKFCGSLESEYKFLTFTMSSLHKNLNNRSIADSRKTMSSRKTSLDVKFLWTSINSLT